MPRNVKSTYPKRGNPTFGTAQNPSKVSQKGLLPLNKTFAVKIDEMTSVQLAGLTSDQKRLVIQLGLAAFNRQH